MLKCQSGFEIIVPSIQWYQKFINKLGNFIVGALHDYNSWEICIHNDYH